MFWVNSPRLSVCWVLPKWIFFVVLLSSVHIYMRVFLCPLWKTADGFVNPYHMNRCCGWQLSKVSMGNNGVIVFQLLYVLWVYNVQYKNPTIVGINYFNPIYPQNSVVISPLSFLKFSYQNSLTSSEFYLFA